MAQGQLRSFLSLIALICLIGGSFATALGLIKIEGDQSDQPIADEEYIVPAAIGNTLCVIFLIWLTATIPTRSTAYKFIVITVLLFGIIGEIYTTFYFTTRPTIYATYVLVVVNFMIRTFYVLEYVQDTWAPISWTDYAGAPRASSSSSSSPPSEKKPDGEKRPDLDDKAREIKKKIGEAVGKMKSDVKGFDGTTQDKAYRAFNAAIVSGKTADDAYRAAKGELKYKDGSAYTGAGRRRA